MPESQWPDVGGSPAAVSPRRAFNQVGAEAALRAEWIRQTTPPPGEEDIVAAFAQLPTAHDHDVDDVWIYGLYLTVLGRLPDPEGHYAQRQLLEAGMSPEVLAAGMAAGAEGLKRQARVPSPLAIAFVTGAFVLTHGRLPDEELDRHVDDLGSHNVPDLTLATIRASAEDDRREPVTSEAFGRCLAVAYQQLVLGIEPRPDLTERLWIAYVHHGHIRCFIRALRDSGQVSRRQLFRARLATLSGRLREVELTARVRHLELQLAAHLDRERLNRGTPPVYRLVAPDAEKFRT